MIGQVQEGRVNLVQLGRSRHILTVFVGLATFSLRFDSEGTLCAESAADGRIVSLDVLWDQWRQSHAASRPAHAVALAVYATRVLHAQRGSLAAAQPATPLLKHRTMPWAPRPHTHCQGPWVKERQG